MKVHEFIKKLEELDPEAEVMAMDEVFGTLLAEEPIQYPGDSPRTGLHRPVEGNIVLITSV